MSRTEVRDALYPKCPIRNVLAHFGNKWALLVLYTLNEQGTSRFKELRRGIPDISQKMLTATLKDLEADGLLRRTAYPEIPPRVEYNLTERAMTLMPLLYELFNWAVDNLEDIVGSREQYLLK